MKRFGIIGTAVLFGVFAFTATARAQDHDKDAQDSHQQEDAKPEKQQPDHNKAAKPEHHDQEKQNDQKKEGQNKDQEKAAQHQDKDQEKAAKQQEKDQQKAEHDQQKQEDKNRKDAEKADSHAQQNDNDHRRDDQRANDQRQAQQSSPERRVSANDQKNVWQEHRAHSWQSEHRTWQQRGGYHGYRIPDDRFRASFGEAHEFVIVNQPVVVVEGFPRFQFAGFWFALVDPLPEYWAPTWYQTDQCYVDYSDGGYYLTDVRYPQVRVAVNVFVQ